MRGKARIIGANSHIWSWNSVSMVGNLTSIYFSYIVDFFHLKIEQLQTPAVCWFNTKTHNMIYSMYCACIHLNCRYYMTDQNPNIVPRDCWGFSGDLIWKAAPEVENLTEITTYTCRVKFSVIPTHPYRGSGLTIECISIDCDSWHMWLSKNPPSSHLPVFREILF